MARSTTVHRSWRVAQQATEKRKESCAVMAQNSAGRGQEGEISSGADRIFDEKSDRILIATFPVLETESTHMRK